MARSEIPSGLEVTPELRCILEACIGCFKQYIDDPSSLAIGVSNRKFNHASHSTLVENEGVATDTAISVRMNLAVAFIVSNAIEIIASMCNLMREGFRPLMIEV